MTQSELLHFAMVPGSGAIFDETGRYRYLLWRCWDQHSSAGAVTFVMLNPSRADAVKNDPTVRRCLGFARCWGYGALQVVNLFAYCATNPCELDQATDPVGPLNDEYVEFASQSAQQLILAWGDRGRIGNRDQQVLILLKALPAFCLGITRRGQPRHPLYLASQTQPMPWPKG